MWSSNRLKSMTAAECATLSKLFVASMSGNESTLHGVLSDMLRDRRDGRVRCSEPRNVCRAGWLVLGRRRPVKRKVGWMSTTKGLGPLVVFRNRVLLFRGTTHCAGQWLIWQLWRGLAQSDGGEGRGPCCVRIVPYLSLDAWYAPVARTFFQDKKFKNSSTRCIDGKLRDGVGVRLVGDARRGVGHLLEDGSTRTC